MYVFNIAQLIRKNFFNDDYKQVFILTHNLYFFHELLHKQKDDNAKLFRLCRSNFSQLSVMNRKDIQNEYQSYWQILKDYDEGKATEVILANAMRNILERFFGFIEKNDFNELTKELEKDEKNNFFIRYINKESHSDPINISDSKEIDPQIFKEAFKKIFKDSGYEAHYNQMMNLNNLNPIN
jgi:wobble nucleotide-excising tRNase